MNIDITGASVRQCYAETLGMLSTIAYPYPPFEEVVAGALLAIQEFAEHHKISVDEVQKALKLAKWKHIDQYECFHSVQDQYIQNFQVHCRECEKATGGHP